MTITDDAAVRRVTHPGISIRRLILADAEKLFALLETVASHEIPQESTRRLSTIRHRIVIPSEPGKIWFGIWHNGVLAGTISITPRPLMGGAGELAYFVGPAFRRRGFATMAVSLLIGQAFSHMGFATLVAFVRRENTASAKVLAHVGFTLIEGKGLVLKYALHRP